MASCFLAGFFLLGGCETETPPYVYRYIPGRTATMDNGYAVAPNLAPFRVRQALSAGNEIAGKPYRYGGGHQFYLDSGYDCSGATSYVLHSMGKLSAAEPSQSFRHYGESGPGRWVTIYATRGHVFLVVAGLRFDTGYGSNGHGPRWLTSGRPAKHYVLRHPAGL